MALISVVNSGGTASNTKTFTVDNSVSLPVIKDNGGLTPSDAAAGGGPFTLTVTGTNFTNSSAVQWSTAAAVQVLSTGYVTDSLGKVVALTAVVPASLIANVGVALITVSNPGNAVSNAVQFDITSSTPFIDDFTPSPIAGKPAFELTVSGNGFVNGSIVRWDNGAGPQALTTGFKYTHTLTALVPATLIASPGTAFITVANPGGIVSNSKSITIKPPDNTEPPIISKAWFSGTKSVNASSFDLTITGSGFANCGVAEWKAAGVTQALTTGWTNSTELIALVPASLLSTPGPVFISVTNPGGAVSNTKLFSVEQPSENVPAISASNGVSPASALVGSPGFQLQVNGRNFQNGSVVQWNSGSGPQALQTGFVNASQVVALAPASLLVAPGIAFITVLNPVERPPVSATCFIVLLVGLPLPELASAAADVRVFKSRSPALIFQQDHGEIGRHTDSRRRE